MESIYGYTLENLEQFFINHNDKKFRATQIFEWIYKRKVTCFEEMTNLKKDLVPFLKQSFYFHTIHLVNKKKGTDVYKFLFELSDLEHIEAVLMLHDYGNSLCVSTQVGCNMGCTFCESGRRKKTRNLTVEEMVSQILQIEKETGLSITHVVLMGIGEPFDNYQNVVDFIKIINSGKGLEIGARHITVSTSGLIPKIKEFMNLPLQVNLAISLHASNNVLRNQLMPINKAYPLEDLVMTLKQYIEKTNRRVTFEYILLDDVNDSEKNALELCALIRGMNAYVNLIPYNETSHLKYRKSKRIQKFYDILKKRNISVTIRREFGSEIQAACGQLRALYEEEKK